jgi:uncharacterized protein (TIGR02246 family)
MSAQEAAVLIGPNDGCQQIERLGTRFDAAFGKDAAAAAALFASQAVIMVRGPAVSGRQAIEASYRTAFEKGWSVHVFRFDQVHVTGDTGP